MLACCIAQGYACDDLQGWDGGGEVGDSRGRGHMYTYG